ncbi:MAG TPA: ATP-binding domain-containing protein [Acidimicrobiales bacterium]|nr:ATP-binding domain-containing protein [Acidimicrobiales bacterium]
MHPDVSEEQAYFDRALEQRERARAQLDRAPDLSSDPSAAAELRKRIGAVGLADPDEGVAFGRIDRRGERIYIGKNAIWDDDNDLLVVNWQAPAASPFYTATPREPQGLDARRTFRCESNQVLDIDELVFQGLAEAVTSKANGQPVLDDALLESLSRNRSGELADIVATIQAAQYDVVSRPVEQLLVVQGGPGTGKTVVGLHRASWLLYNLSDRLQSEDVLVVGPNPAFVRYIRAVLPRLGDEAVVQRSVTELGPRVRSGRVESPVIRRLKGDRRMIELIVRGLRNRQRVGTDPVELTVDNRRVTLDPGIIAGRASQLDRRPHNEAHKGLREFVIQEVQSYLGRRGVLDSTALEATTRGASAREIDNYLDRVWPNLTPQAFLLELFATRTQLEAAAEGILDEHEIALLSVPRDAKVGSYEWSLDDIPLLDAADFLLNGPQRMYEYIVLDEAQDLSPMQLLSIARRSRNGWMTVLGDLAQATSPCALGSWNEVADHLYRPSVPANLAELRLGYRLPTEVHEVAMRLLRQIAPGLATPESIRPSGEDVLVDQVDSDDLTKAMVARVRTLLGTGLIGVIAPDAAIDGLTAALDAEGLFWAPELQVASAPIVVMTAERAKGLEFDNVVVVNPSGIIEEHGENGMRALFVALTRCTRRLAIVHDVPLPEVLGLGRRTPGTIAAGAGAAGGSNGGNGMRRAIPVVEVGVVDSPIGSGSGVDGTGAAPGAGGGPGSGSDGPHETGEDLLAELGDDDGPVTATWGGPRPAAPTGAPTVSGAGASGHAVPAGASVPGSSERAAPGVEGSGGGAAGDGGPTGATSPGGQPGPVPAEAGPGGGPGERRGSRRSGGSELELQVAATVTSAIAESLATTLRRLVQPALLPDIVDELERLVSGPPTSGPPTGGPPTGATPVELPAELVAQAERAVAAGQATSVSGYIADALESKGRLAAVAGQVSQLLADADGALTTGPDDPSVPPRA